MSDFLHHECGIALVRLLKPLSFYHKKYGTSLYGLNKLYLLMEKQHNRGQDGAGVATIKLDPAPGDNFRDRERSTDKDAIQKIFGRIQKGYLEATHTAGDRVNDPSWLKSHVPF